MALLGNRRRAEQLETENAQLRELVPQGAVVESPYVESAPSRSLLPWRRTNEIAESAPAVKAPARAGFIADVPRGGANENNQGYTQIGGATDRRTLMQQLQMLYVSCPWSHACVDAIARFSTAGGMSIEPDDETNQRKETVKLSPQAQKAQDLFDYVNPAQNFRQLMRGIFTDLLIYGDSFIEVVWALGEPIALYSLPSPDMLIDADEHGVVNFYVQRTETDRRAKFEPHEVIHIKFDSPRGGLYGLGPTEKSVHAITTWLFTEGLLKATMKKGDPPNLAVAWDENLALNEIKTLTQQYSARNLGPDNVGNLISFKGKSDVHEFAQNKVEEYLATKAGCRDEMCGSYGVPPAIATIIESGNLGGGTGTSQFKNFKVNTCGPVQEIVLESLTFYILQQGFGVEDSRCKFGEVDWRDDAVIEEISHTRITDGRWTINRGRDEIGEPPVPGGDDAVIIQTRDVVLVKDLAAMSEAAVEKISTGAATPPGMPTVPDDSNAVTPVNAPALPTGGSDPADSQDPKHATGSPRESSDEKQMYEAFGMDLRERLKI